jgi:hypothetical protein
MTAWPVVPEPAKKSRIISSQNVHVWDMCDSKKGDFGA